MTTSQKLLCGTYAVIAMAALIATWSQNIAYLGGSHATSGMLDFWRDTRANPASQSITVDLLLLFLAAAIFMVIEARKHNVRFVWAYILGGMLIAISVTFPLFLIARELRLASSETPRLPVLDKALLGAFAAGLAAFAFWVDLA